MLEKKGKTFENLSTFSSVWTRLLYNLFSWYFTFLSFPDLWREYRRKIISAHDILERLWRKSVKEQGKTFRNWCHQTKWLTTPKVLMFNLCTNIDKMISIFFPRNAQFFHQKIVFLLWMNVPLNFCDIFTILMFLCCCWYISTKKDGTQCYTQKSIKYSARLIDYLWQKECMYISVLVYLSMYFIWKMISYTKLPNRKRIE